MKIITVIGKAVSGWWVQNGLEVMAQHGTSKIK